MPPILITQHMPAGFTASFAKRLNSLTRLTVEEFSGERQAIKNNTVYLAKGDKHIILSKRNNTYSLLQDDSPPVNRHKPSVEVLFNSAAKTAGERAIGIILTGMGIDGADGLKNMKDAGAFTIAQDEASSVVWGMPRIAIERGAATEVLSLGSIAERITHYCYKKRRV